MSMSTSAYTPLVQVEDGSDTNEKKEKKGPKLNANEEEKTQEDAEERVKAEKKKSDSAEEQAEGNFVFDRTCCLLLPLVWIGACMNVAVTATAYLTVVKERQVTHIDRVDAVQELLFKMKEMLDPQVGLALCVVGPPLMHTLSVLAFWVLVKGNGGQKNLDELKAQLWEKKGCWDYKYVPYIWFLLLSQLPAAYDSMADGNQAGSAGARLTGDLNEQFMNNWMHVWIFGIGEGIRDVGGLPGVFFILLLIFTGVQLLLVVVSSILAILVCASRTKGFWVVSAIDGSGLCYLGALAGIVNASEQHSFKLQTERRKGSWQMRWMGRFGKIIAKGAEDLPILTFLISLFGLTYHSSEWWQLSVNVLSILFSFIGIAELLLESLKSCQTCMFVLPLGVGLFINVIRFFGTLYCVVPGNANTFQLMPFPHCDGDMQ